MIPADLGSDWVRLTIGGALVPADRVGTATIRHGRERVGEQPPASALTVTIDADGLAALPDIGQAVTLELGPDAETALGMSAPEATAARTRFVGDITDLVDVPGAGPLTSGGYLTIVATSRRARLGRVQVGADPWPAELDGARAARVLTAAAPAAGITVGTVDAGAVTVLARAAALAGALDVLEALARDTDALLVARRDGVLEWHDREHRRTSAPIAVTLGAADVLRDVAWIKNLAGLENTVTLGYGAADPQATVTAADPVSVDVFGPLGEPGAIGTQLALEVDAAELAGDRVARRSRPAWRIERLTVELLRTVTAAQAVDLLSLEVGALLGITGFPEAGPHHVARLFVEGWTETLSRYAWALALAVSDYGLTGASPRWVDVDPAITWADVDPTLTWLAAAGWSLDIDQERWLDVPSDRAWADVDPTLTWPAYTN